MGGAGESWTHIRFFSGAKVELMKMVTCLVQTLSGGAFVGMSAAMEPAIIVQETILLCFWAVTPRGEGPRVIAGQDFV